MALDINGYNADFNAFVKFAQDNIATKETAVARFGEGPAPRVSSPPPPAWTKSPRSSSFRRPAPRRTAC
ncbi:MAG: hypothetical protein IJL17_03280 [Kiritimatiellae bacterium]|nr:hypothetical protein [Kiritimatiellia bacterium]